MAAALYFEGATLEQRILWDHVKGFFAYTTITPVFYMGPIAGSEFITYLNTKLYIALELAISFDLVGGVSGVPGINIYNEANLQKGTLFNLSAYWDPTVVAMQKQLVNQIKTKNFYFGRIEASVYGNLIFCGYRLNV